MARVRGRVFGRINIIDFVFVLIMVAVAVGAAAYKSAGAAGAKAAAVEQKLEMKFLSTEQPDFVVDSIMVGDNVLLMDGMKFVGKVIGIERGQSEFTGLTDEGQFTAFPKQGYSSVVLTVEAAGKLESGATMVGGKEFYLVKTYDIYAGKAAMSCRLYSVSRVD